MFDLRAEEARLLISVALMAAGGNRFSGAAKLLDALEEFRPDSPSVPAARAVALISAGREADCLEYLRGAPAAKFAGDPMLAAFEGMALIRLGRRAEARGPLEAAAGQAADPAAAGLAKGLLEDDRTNCS